MLTASTPSHQQTTTKSLSLSLSSFSMDFNLKQWRNIESGEDDEQEAPSQKLPRLILHSHPHQHPSPLPLFLSQPNTNLSPDHSTATTKFPRMGSNFSLTQWQELELQALIFRHMLAGADVPPDLLHLVKKSFINSPYYLSHHLHHYFPHYQPSLLQSAYWGRGAMDPEPGRCRRTDGKKWRCSRDVVAGQKYCERHMHRGKNRSRKPVEIPTSTTSPYGGARPATPASGGAAPHFTLSVPSQSADLLHLNQRPPDSIIDAKCPFEARNDGQAQTLRHFFDDWPKPIHDMDNSSTNLSISMPENPSSDFSLKLGTGNVDEPSAHVSEREKRQLNWEMMWGNNPVASMGGPLAEALRSSTSTSSPTSVLHRLPPPRGVPASEPSYVSY